jgi:hypothetical protein
LLRANVAAELANCSYGGPDESASVKNETELRVHLMDAIQYGLTRTNDYATRVNDVHHILVIRGTSESSLAQHQESSANVLQ